MVEKDIETSIPIGVLREEVAKVDSAFKSRSKDEYIKKLKQINQKLLSDFANYYSSIRENRLFLCKIKSKFVSKFKKTQTVISKLSGLKYTDKEGVVYHTEGVSFVPSQQAVFFKVIVHSDLKKFDKEKPAMDGNYDLQYRDKKVAICLLHLSPFCLEIRAGLRSKAELALAFLHSKFFEEENASSIYSLSDDEKKELAGLDGLRFKEAVFEGLSLEGCDEIIIKGEDVGRTIDYFKKAGVDLQKKANVSHLKREESTNQQFKFYDDGKISVKKKIKNPFEVITGVVFKDGKQ